MTIKDWPYPDLTPPDVVSANQQLRLRRLGELHRNDRVAWFEEDPDADLRTKARQDLRGQGFYLLPTGAANWLYLGDRPLFVRREVGLIRQQARRLARTPLSAEAKDRLHEMGLTLLEFALKMGVLVGSDLIEDSLKIED